jgi:serine/threonine protein kinase
MGPVGERFELLRELGRGSYGEAHLARDATSGLHVVVKLLHARLLDQGTALERFRREVRALAKLNHPNVVQLVATGTCRRRRQPYYAMTWSPGLPLDRVLEQHGRLAPDLALRLTDQLLSALEAAAAIGVVHRDLKPGNLIVESLGDGDERLLVIDFGLAKHLADDVDEELTGKRPVGTPTFMAPEQCKGDAVSSATDVYAVACILVMLLTGRPPFVGDTPLVLLASHVHEDAPRLDALLPGAPAPLVAAVAAALRKEPGERPSATELRRALRRIDPRTLPAGAPGAARPRAPAEPTLLPEYGRPARATSEPTLLPEYGRAGRAARSGADAASRREDPTLVDASELAALRPRARGAPPAVPSIGGRDAQSMGSGRARRRDAHGDLAPPTGGSPPASSSAAISRTGASPPASSAAISRTGGSPPASSSAAISRTGGSPPASSSAAISRTGGSPPASSSAAISRTGGSPPASSSAAISRTGGSPPASSSAAISRTGGSPPASSSAAISRTGSSSGASAVDAAPPCPRARLALLGAIDDRRWVLLATPRLRIGHARKDGGRTNDLALGARAERPAKLAQAHASLAVRDEVALVSDDGGGVRVDGVAIAPGRAVALRDRFELDLGGAVRLRGQVLRESSGPSGGAGRLVAVRLERPADPSLSWVLVALGADVGAGDGDALVIPGAPATSARVSVRAGRFLVVAPRVGAPLAVGGRAVPAGSRQPLAPGDVLGVGAARLRFGLEVDDDA